MQYNSPIQSYGSLEWEFSNKMYANNPTLNSSDALPNYSNEGTIFTPANKSLSGYASNDAFMGSLYDNNMVTKPVSVPNAANEGNIFSNNHPVGGYQSNGGFFGSLYDNNPCFGKINVPKVSD